MTDLRQAAQQALEALQELDGLDTETECVTIDVGDVIAALRTALEQQQAEPVAYFDFQELKFSWAKHMKIGPVPVSIKVEPMKLYTTPPQRPWVGLTDEERMDVLLALNWDKQLTHMDTAKSIEAKLKERNHDR